MTAWVLSSHFFCLLIRHSIAMNISTFEILNSKFKFEINIGNCMLLIANARSPLHHSRLLPIHNVLTFERTIGKHLLFDLDDTCLWWILHSLVRPTDNGTFTSTINIMMKWKLGTDPIKEWYILNPKVESLRNLLLYNLL